MSTLKYKYVFSWFSKQPKKKEDFKLIGCASMQEVAIMASNMSSRDKFYVYSKKEADKIGFIPDIVCSKSKGPRKS